MHQKQLSNLPIITLILGIASCMVSITKLNSLHYALVFFTIILGIVALKYGPTRRTLVYWGITLSVLSIALAMALPYLGALFQVLFLHVEV